MHYWQVWAEPPLDEWVTSVWGLRGTTDIGVTQRPDAVLPDGCAEIVLHLGDSFSHLKEGEVHAQPGGVLVGQIVNPMTLLPGRDVDTIGIRLRPWAVSAVLHEPAHIATERTIPLDDIATGLLSELLERLSKAADPADRARAIAATLVPRLRRAKRLDLEAAFAARWIRRAGGQARVDDVARVVGSAPRTLERKFRETVGVGPKLLCRIARFQAVVRAADSGEPLAWSDLAGRFGYYDQAHLTRDFRQFAGCSPGRFFASAHPLSTLFLDS